VVEDGGLCGTRRLTVVMDRDSVEQLGPNRRVQVSRALLDHAEPEVDVPQQSPLLGLAKDGATPQLAYAAGVVEERRREEEVAAQPWVELRRLAAQGGHPNRVLEQSSCVAVVAVDPSRGKRAIRLANGGISQQRAHDLGEPGMGDLPSEELEEAVQLVGVPSQAFFF
jgi:hypothetical protein